MRPSGLKRDGGDRAVVCAEMLVDQMAVAGVPDPHDSGLERAATRVRPSGLQARLQNRFRWALEAEDGQAGVDGVEHEARVRPGPGEAAAVGAEGEGADAARRAQIRMFVSGRDPCRPP